MKKPMKHIEEARKVYDLFWDSYLVGDIDTFATTLDENFEMIGTSESEHCHNKGEGIEFIKAQKEELIGSVEMRNREVTELPIGNVMLINEFCDLYVLSETDWSFYSKFRSSAMLRETEDGWKMAQQHGSLPDMRVGEGETLAIEKITKENIELRDAVKRRTAELEHKNRELEIEAALDRVRARSMAMHKSEELVEVVRQLKKEIMELGIDIDVTQIVIDFTDDPHDGLNDWVSVEGQRYLQKFHIPFIDHPITTKFYETLENDLDTFTVKYSKPEKNAYFKLLFEHSDFKDIPEERKNFILEAPGWVNCVVIENNCSMQFARYRLEEFNHEERDLFKRFTSVFGQAYTRFLDLQKAEEQAREAQIEAALERVRAQSMGMQQSEELINVVQQIGRELKEMGIEVHNSQIWTDISVDPNASINIWLHVEGQSYLEKFHFPLSDHPIDSELIEAIEKDLPLFSSTYSKSEIASYFKYAFNETELKRIPQERKDIILNAPGWTRCTVLLNEACLQLSRFNLDKFTEDEQYIFKRLGKVFDQAYTRFLDLQKAEEQAREAQIEAALERVRAKGMAMHSTNDIESATAVVFNELSRLGIDLERCGITLMNETPVAELWSTTLSHDNKEVIDIVTGYLDFRIHPLTQKSYRDWKEKKKFSTYYLVGEELIKYYDKLEKQPEYKFPKVDSYPDQQVLHSFFFNAGAIFVYTTTELSTESKNIVHRFTKVFEQTYTRFLDLRKAEAQAREAMIEAALERVRARSMAMQKSDELHDVLSVLFEQFDVLGIHPVNVFLSLFSKEDKTLTYRATGTGGSRTQGQQVVSLDSLDVWKKLFEKWRNDNSESVEVIYYDKEILPTLFSLLDETFSSMPENERLTRDHFPEGGYTAHGYTPFGYIGFNHTRMPTDEEKDILTKFASEFSRIYQRFLDIERAEAQSRESEIQLALERVRARTMAMHNSDELGEVASVLFEQISSLTTTPDRFNIAIANEADVSFDIFITDQNGFEIKNRFNADVKGSPVLSETFENWKNDAPHLIQDIHGKMLENWIRYMGDIVGIPFNMEQVKDHRFLSSVFFSHGFIGITTHEEPNSEIIHLLERFSKVFQQTYVRFLDLQKAEEQAREAQIEAALERVRSRSLAMHKTDELQNVVRVVAEELKNIGVILDTGGAVICTYFQDSKDVVHWTATEDPAHPSVPYLLPYFEDELFDEAWASKNRGDDYFAKEFSYDVKNSFWKYAFEHSDYRQLPDEYKKIILESESHGLAWAWSENSAIMIPSIQGDLPSEEEKKILVRFAKVFEQSFIRFLDLQKAEKQTREAQIEAALERVRSHTMGMQRSEDMAQTASEMFRQIETLGMHPWGCGFNIFDEDEKAVTQYMSLADGGMSPPFRTPLTEDPFFINIYDARQRKEELLVMESSGESLAETYRYMFGLPGSGEIFGDLENSGFEMPKYQITHCAYFSQGYLVFITYESVPEAHDIFMRFAKVFEQTYTRFLDLKKAEKLAIETARQSSLDRIRAEIGSMRSAEDLQQITPIIWDELKTLDIPFIRCGVFIIDEENELSHTYLSTSQGDPIAALHLPLEDIPLVKNAVSSWKQKKIYTEHWDEEDFREWTQNLIDRGFIQSKKKYEAGSAPETLDLHFLPFKHGMLYIGNTEPLSQEKLDLGQSMAKAFSVAYDRYEDFNKLEQAKLKIEEAFRELEAAKDQLVQQEKLASLGQLTAGIAHEIKNPLNFVNNFSDLSTELIQEARDEIESVRAYREMPLPDDALDEMSAILNDIETNLKTIHKHGTRADGIVKSMLQHSRGGSGKMVPTDVNAVIKEYANLAFHGMRAGKDPINVDIELDLDENMDEVEMIAEDFSRVILNLCNNAFDAMREKLTADSRQLSENPNQSYEPILSIRTHSKDSKITIEIEDNGPGIPEEIKDKILQPFFTTKKGTAGTGLGLSITNDIVKAHGGNIDIHSSATGTSFNILIPSR